MKELLKMIFEFLKSVSGKIDLKSIIIPGVLLSLDLLMKAIKKYGQKIVNPDEVIIASA